MPVHFAAARSAAHSPIARALARKALARAANDNGDGARIEAQSSRFDTMMRAALRHFAEHGLRAAETARLNAEEAHFAGDREAYVWWLGICRTLDKRLATRFERRLIDDEHLIG